MPRSTNKNAIAQYVLPLVSQGLKADWEHAKMVLLNYATFAQDRDPVQVKADQIAASPYLMSTSQIEAGDMTAIEGQKAAFNLREISSAPAGSVLVLPVNGVLSRETQYWASSYMTSTRFLEGVFDAVEGMPNISAVVVQLNSPGGQASGNQSLARCIQNCSKPVVVSFEGMASAAVEAFIGADEIYALEDDSYFGSIGTYTQITDCTQFWEESGIKTIEIYAEQSTEKNKEVREALAGNPQPMQDRLTRSTEFFIKDVKKMRPQIKDDGLIFKGKLYNAREARKIGAIDGIKPFSFVLGRAMTLARSNARKSKSTNKMSKETQETANTAKEKESGFLKSVSSFLGFGDTKSEQDKVKEGLEAAMQRSADLQKSNKTLEEKNAELEQSNKALAEENKAAKAEIEQLKGKLKEQEQANQKFADDFAHIKGAAKIKAEDEAFDSVKSLVEGYNSLVKHNKELAPAQDGATPKGEQEKNNIDRKTFQKGASVDDIYAQIEENTKKMKEANKA